MIRQFSRKSKEQIETCDPRLQEVLESFLQVAPCDFSVVYGFRGQEIQDRLVAEKKSKTPWPKSKHNNMKDGKPSSLAVDVCPYIPGRGQIWGNTEGDVRTIVYLMGALVEHARNMGVVLRWGGDWDSDGDVAETRFFDSFHVEIKE